MAKVIYVMLADNIFGKWKMRNITLAGCVPAEGSMCAFHASKTLILIEYYIYAQ